MRFVDFQCIALTTVIKKTGYFRSVEEKQENELNETNKRKTALTYNFQHGRLCFKRSRLNLFNLQTSDIKLNWHLAYVV